MPRLRQPKQRKVRRATNDSNKAAYDHLPVAQPTCACSRASPARTALERKQEELAKTEAELAEGRAYAAELVGELDDKLEGAQVKSIASALNLSANRHIM